ncbi:MAG: outer membrane beta-barrel protein [Ignavibacteriales bacterium]|nr:MAG: outer membrane beta-barrel protein [Ignavibacteriales bacterium]
MKNKKILLTVAAILLLLSSNSFAQFRMSVAPVTGMGFSIHNGSDLNQSGNGFGVTAGALIDMQFNQSVGLLTNIGFYDNRSGSYEDDITFQPGVVGTIENSVSLSYFTIEPLFKFQFPSRFYLMIGPAIGFNLSAENEIVEKITTPGWTFDGQNTTRKSKGTIRNTNVRFELKAGMGYNIRVANGFDIAPQVTFGYGLTNVVEDVNWKILTIQANVAFKFAVL